MRLIKALRISKALIQHLILSYGPPVTILSANGTQFTSRLFQFVYTELKMRSVTTATYHTHTNGQYERFNRTTLAGLRAFVSKHLKSLSEYAELLAFSYNTQFHPSLGCTPFDLILSNPPVSLTLRPEQAHENMREPRKALEQFQASIRRLTREASERLDEAQGRYKRNYDKRVNPIAQPEL